ncbi:MAG TPA: hypothetical protein VM937_11405 [Burkholderiaceae bacterium]|jgi:hypothetical protein|nr:hypothetical protein [Burkholderiaceae bacterium]
MAHILRLKHTYQRTRSGFIATIRAVARAIASEHTLALRASEKVASSCRNAAEVRAMYVPTPNASDNNDVDQATRRAG